MFKATWILRCVSISAILIGTGIISSVMAQVIEKEGAKPTNGRPSRQTATVDRQTGKVREPTEAEAAALTDALNKQYGRTSTDIKVTQHANGMVSAELPADFSEVMVVKLNPDGTLSRECVTGEKNAEAVVQEWDKTRTAPPATKTKAKSKAPVARKVARKEPVK